MKKKLTLDKFKVSKITNPESIKGGNGEPNATRPTFICVETSSNWVKR